MENSTSLSPVEKSLIIFHKLLVSVGELKNNSLKKNLTKKNFTMGSNSLYIKDIIYKKSLQFPVFLENYQTWLRHQYRFHRWIFPRECAGASSRCPSPWHLPPWLSCSARYRCHCWPSGSSGDVVLIARATTRLRCLCRRQQLVAQSAAVGREMKIQVAKWGLWSEKQTWAMRRPWRLWWLPISARCWCWGLESRWRERMPTSCWRCRFCTELLAVNTR